MTRVLSSASGEPWRAFDAEAQLLAHTLRAGRLTVLVGAIGVDKTTLLITGVLPLLRRRVGDEFQRPGDAPQVVESLPDRRSRVQGRDHGELLHFVDKWNQEPLDSLLRALDDMPAVARVRFDLAEAMSPAHLSALSQRHGGAHLLFVFDHFELLVECAKHNADLQRFVDAWAAAVQAPGLNVHFLVAVDEHAWSWLQSLCATNPEVELRAFRLQARSGRQALESLTDNQPGNGAADYGVLPADFAASLDESLARVAKVARAGHRQLSDLAASPDVKLSPVSSSARPAESRRGGQATEAAREALARQVADGAAKAAEAERITEAARLVEAQRLAQALAAAEATAAREVQARKLVEAAAKAAEAERRAEAERNAEAARQAEAARRIEAQRLAQALATAEATAAREVQARKVVEAAAKAAEAELRAEAERNAEAARQAEAARRIEAQRLAQALAAAEATAAREVQARKVVEAGAKAADAERRAEAKRRAEEVARAAAGADARRSAEAQQRVQEELLIAAAARSSPVEPDATESANGLLGPTIATAGPARTVLLLGAALLAVAVAAVQWWHTRPSPPVATAPTSPEAAAPPHTADLASVAASSLASAPAESGRYEMLAVTANGTRARIVRELAGALSPEPTAMRVVPPADGADPITWLQAPDRLAVARLDALRAASVSAAPPLRVLTPLFSEAVLFVVRADSPLKYIHDLNGRRLSIGPVQGDGSHTVREIYRRLFGAEMTEPAQFDTDQAVAELVAFRSIDAMAIVEPRPLTWWASLDPSIARRLRLLTLDPRHPADRRLLQTLGTPVVRIGAGVTKGMRTTTPAVMSYLVTSGEGDADVDRLMAMARALCRELPRLREQGDPIWQELQPLAQLDTGWPVVRPFQSALSRCVRR